MSGIEVIGLISAIVGIVEAIGKVSKALKDAKDLPQAFHEVAERLPLVRDTLRTVESHISNDEDEEAYQAMKKVLEECREKAENLEEIFKAIAPSEHTSRLKRYAMAVRRLGKENLVEILAKGMMEDAHLLVLNHAAQAATEAQVMQLSEAIGELSKMEPSLPEEDSVSQTHYGSGDNVAGNKYAGNHNEYHGSGAAYFAPVTQHVHPEKTKEQSLSQDCLRSLAFEGMDSRPTEIKTAVGGTCQWLLQHETYKSWESRDRALLWIKGKPGSGKSTLLRHARDSVETLQRNGGRPLIISFFFNGRGTELQKTPVGFFRSLLCQFQSKFPEALEALEATFKQRDAAFGEYGKMWQWGPSEPRQYFELSLWKALETHPVWLFVDALDECGDENARNLAEEFNSLLHRHVSDRLKQFRICFTCRHYPILDLSGALEICAEKENERDISIFVQNKLSSFRERTGSTIPEFISKHAEGVFLWACLVVNKVLDLERERAGLEKIEAEVRSVPRTLDKLYGEVIRNMGPDSPKLIEWICFASRPLGLAELRWAMLVEQNCAHQSLQECQSTGKYPSNDAGMLWEIQTLGCGLVEYKSDTKVVQFIHQSVKDFFIEKGLQSLRDSTKPERVAGFAHYRLARICLHYLSMKDFSQAASLQRDGIMPKFPFLHYATTSWVAHVANIPDDLQEYFLWPSNAAVERWRCLYRQVNSDTLEGGTTLLHIMSGCGLAGALRAILKRADQLGVDPNARDLHGRTPLCSAAIKGHTAAVELLLGNGAQPDLKEAGDLTPLHWAVRYGYTAVVKLLLDNGAQPGPKDAIGHTPLSLAIENRDSVVIELLLKKGAKVDYHYAVGDWSTDLPWRERAGEIFTGSGITGLLMGASPAYVGFITGGLALGAGVLAVWSAIAAGAIAAIHISDQPGAPWRTPLSRAAELGDETVVRLLLRYNAQVDYQDKYGETALSRAIKGDKKEIIRLLRERSAHGSVVGLARSRGT